MYFGGASSTISKSLKSSRILQEINTGFFFFFPNFSETISFQILFFTNTCSGPWYHLFVSAPSVTSHTDSWPSCLLLSMAIHISPSLGNSLHPSSTCSACFPSFLTAGSHSPLLKTSFLIFHLSARLLEKHVFLSVGLSAHLAITSQLT